MKKTDIQGTVFVHRLPIAKYCEFVNTPPLKDMHYRVRDKEQREIEFQKIKAAIQFLDYLEATPHMPKDVYRNGWPANSDHPRFFKAMGMEFFLDHPYSLDPLPSEYRVQNLPKRLNVYSPHTLCRLAARVETEMGNLIFDTVLQRILSSDMNFWPGHTKAEAA